MPAHFGAFRVEIKVRVVEARIVQLLHCAGISLSHGKLIALLVDEVDQDLRAIDANLLVEMSTSSSQLTDE